MRSALWTCLMFVFVPMTVMGSAAASDSLPANEWVTSGELPPGPYQYAPLMHVPGRKVLYHWGLNGRFMRGNPAPMRVYDPLARTCASDSEAAIRSAGLCNAVCWDSKRKRIVYAPNGRMLTYDPDARAWTNLNARTILYGKTWQGAPPVEGGGMCYDPVNDEIVMFPHWSGVSRPKNVDRLDVDGRISGHLGTLIFRFKDNTWRRVAPTIGPPAVRRARDETLKILAGVSKALDAAWVYRRRPKDAALQPAGMSSALSAAADAFGKVSGPGQSGAEPGKAVPHLAAAARAAKKGDMDAVLAAGRDALWAIEAALDGSLRVEPPPRCAAPMLYCPPTRSIYMFGGLSGEVRTDLGRRTGPGALNDTWVYDCATRTWHELKTEGRPSIGYPTGFYQPPFFHDPASGLVFFLDLQVPDSRRGRKQVYRIWALDPKSGTWTLRKEAPWPHPIAYVRGLGSGSPKIYAPVYVVGYDPERRLLVLTQQARNHKSELHVMRLDPARLEGQSAPAWKPDPPIQPQVLPPDDPEWLVGLKTLPANTWVAAKPKGGGASRRDWGNSAYDPIRGTVYYFGGGHATYQVADVAVYAAGANRWVHQAGDHNSFLPPNAWGGICMGYRGGMWAHHQRNEYMSVDGRMYVTAHQSEKVNPTGEMPGRNASSRRPPGKPGPRNVWFYDLDRGGIWRMARVPDKNMTVQAGVDRVWDTVQMSTPDGRLLAFYGPRGKRMTCVRIFDPYRLTIEYRKAGGTLPPQNGESRAFTYIPNRETILYVTGSKGKEVRTWLYDIRTNTWTDSKAANAPRNYSRPTPVLLYMADHDAVFAVMTGNKEHPGGQYVYSMKHNAWTPLPHKGARVHYGGPYGQVEYCDKYGVLFGCVGSMIMRPDVSELDWGIKKTSTKMP